MPEDNRTSAIYKSVGRLVAQARKSAGLKQAELAGLTGGRLSRSAVANIESGRQRVALHHLLDLADALGVAAEELLPPADEIPPLPANAAADLMERLAGPSREGGLPLSHEPGGSA